MKKGFKGFTLVEVMIIISIIGIMTAIALPRLMNIEGGTQNTPKIPKEIPVVANFEQPTVGQIYIVTAADPEVKAIIATPHNFPFDKNREIKRRIFLSVKDKNICEKGVWFIISQDGVENIIQSPANKSVEVEKASQ